MKMPLAKLVKAWKDFDFEVTKNDFDDRWEFVKKTRYFLIKQTNQWKSLTNLDQKSD